MFETLFMFIYIGSILYILKQDIETKYIGSLGFYFFIILSGIYYFLEFQNIWGLIPIVFYSALIIFLEIIENYSGTIASIGEKWKLGNTGIYDYFLYIFITDIIISNMIQNFGNYYFIFDFILIGLITGFLGILILKFHQLKVKYMIYIYNITDYDHLDTYLYDGFFNGISFGKIFKTNIIFSQKQEQLFLYYKKRVPLFVFGNIFILAYIGVSIINKKNLDLIGVL